MRPRSACSPSANTAAPEVRSEAGPGAPGMSQRLCLPPGRSSVGTDQLDSRATPEAGQGGYWQSKEEGGPWGS